MKFEYIYGKQAEQYDYLYIPKAFMKERTVEASSSTYKSVSDLIITGYL